MKCPKLWVVFFLFLSLPLWGREQYALKENLNCTACHYSPAGGGPLNIKGRYYNRQGFTLEGFAEYLATLQKLVKERKTEKGSVTGQLITTALEKLSIQGIVRTLFKQTIDREPDVKKDNFDLLDATMVLGLSVHDKLNIIYAPELNNLHAGDVFITGEGPWGTFVQVGRFTPPFGLTSDDPTIMVRSLYGLQYFLKDIGATVGYDQHGFFTNLSVLNAFRHFSPASEGLNGIGDPFRGMGMTANIGFHMYHFIFGLSALYEVTGDANRDRDETDSESLFALYSSLSWGKFRLSGEVDLGLNKGIGVRNRAGIEPDFSPHPVRASTASFVDPFFGKISPNFAKKSFGAFAKASVDILPNKWDISAQYDTLSGNIKFLGDAPIRVTLATKYWPWRNFSVEPQYKRNFTPKGAVKNAPNAQLEDARRKNKDQFLIYASATF